MQIISLDSSLPRTQINARLTPIRAHILRLYAQAFDWTLQAGLKVMIRKGYIGAGVRDIAGGAFPAGLIHQPRPLKGGIRARGARPIPRGNSTGGRRGAEDCGLRPRERLERYLDLLTDRLAQDRFRRGC